MSQDRHLILDNCIKCNICVANCPVVKVTDQYAGPKQNGPDLERFRLDEPAAVHPSISYCSNCKTCDFVCPSGVNVATMNCKAKGEYVALNGAPLRDQVLGRVEWICKAAQIAPSIVNWAAGVGPFRAMGEAFFGVAADMPFPRFASKTFLQQFQPKKIANPKGKVLYYPGCYVNYYTPEVGLALAKVLAHNGIEMVVDDFNCCGLPTVSNGLMDAAKAYGVSNLEKLNRYIQDGYAVVTTCPSCNLMLRQEYHELFDMDTTLVTENTYDAFEYLVLLHEKGQLDTQLKALPRRYGYHQPCHLRAVGYGVPSQEILQLIPDLQVLPLDAGCCGLSGSYGFKKEKYPISREIGQNIVRAVEDTGVKQAVTECGMCQLQVNHVTGLPVVHPIELLAEAYGL
ncbi:anaerobic glycerol-3-phosphate dehydrogenase subunit C [Heliobacterium gestii]|uniref:Anaerobic glycerol-3-phosphate dehydrogenase subunit C n=1 Tax=Heliomicrobium gestii TaxID=2699 RepID=A0A845LGV7_HELGE|nr:anaerobic glycerol-3-phosphate dehydrogenase subunit C [Heliomicrobium gestii]MBM7865961.1 glycerol-3-phosphate dehydrogenase subunit C [Heliomicrobium gestii]MZP42703.1 anaerobic glycerol-3-phosphate dehydrogenase subunit C [Heliomicrobium gestii]